MGGYDGERGYADERWPGDDRGYPEGDWGGRRGGGGGGGYREDERGRGGGYAPADVNGGYGAEPTRFGPPAPPPPPPYDPGYGPGPGPGPGSPISGPGPGAAFGPRPPERGAPLLDPPTTQVPQQEPRSRAADRDESGVYRSRKPLHAALIGVSLGVFELIMFLVFVRGVFQFDVSRIVAGGLMMMALPLFGLGFYALITGAAHGGPRAFLKTPLAYLPIGLILMIAAGAAA